MYTVNDMRSMRLMMLYNVQCSKVCTHGANGLSESLVELGSFYGYIHRKQCMQQMRRTSVA